MAERKAKAGTRKSTKSDFSKKEARERRLNLASLPGKSKTSKKTGISKISSRQEDRATGGKNYGWVEDHPTDPSKVCVKNRWISDHPEGRGESDYCLAGLEEGRPDAGSRIGNKKKYNNNYDEVFGKRHRGVAAGHKVFKKKYK